MTYASTLQRSECVRFRACCGCCRETKGMSAPKCVCSGAQHVCWHWGRTALIVLPRRCITRVSGAVPHLPHLSRDRFFPMRSFVHCRWFFSTPLIGPYLCRSPTAVIALRVAVRSDPPTSPGHHSSPRQVLGSKSLLVYRSVQRNLRVFQVGGQSRSACASMRSFWVVLHHEVPLAMAVVSSVLQAFVSSGRMDWLLSSNSVIRELSLHDVAVSCKARRGGVMGRNSGFAVPAPQTCCPIPFAALDGYEVARAER